MKTTTVRGFAVISFGLLLVGAVGCSGEAQPQPTAVVSNPMPGRDTLEAHTTSLDDGRTILSVRTSGETAVPVVVRADDAIDARVPVRPAPRGPRSSSPSRAGRR